MEKPSWILEADVPPQIHGLLGGYQGWPQWVAWQICYLMAWLASAATFESFPAVREVFISMSETTDAKKQQGSLHRGTSFQRWSEANTRPPGRFPGRMLLSVSIPQMFPMLTIWCLSIWSFNTKARQKVLEAICYCRNHQNLWGSSLSNHSQWVRLKINATSSQDDELSCPRSEVCIKCISSSHGKFPQWWPSMWLYAQSSIARLHTLTLPSGNLT